MIKKRLQWRLGILLTTAALILAGLYYYGVYAHQKKAPPVYSVILYQNTLDEWGTLTEGAKQAQEDLNIHVNYVYLEKGDTATEQAEAIRRELREGSDGIILAAADSEGIRQAFDADSFPVPLLCVETGIGEPFPVIRSDDRAMGRAMGMAILENMEQTGGERKVTVLKACMERDSVGKRYEGLMEILKGAEKQVEIEEYACSSNNLEKIIAKILAGHSPYLAVLDKYAGETAAGLWAEKRSVYEKQGKSCRIYGIGNTARTVNALDNGNMEALIYQNEFNMGYQAVECLARERKKSWMEENVRIGYRTVTGDTLYEDENQRLLFSNT